MSMKREPKDKRREEKERRETIGAESSRGFYVYCLGERAALASIFEEKLPTPIEPDSSLEMVDVEDLAAVVSAVSLDEFGEDALQSNLMDPTWTALRAMRHERVVEHFGKRASIVPLRFGTIYLERESIQQMLEERRADLLAIINRLRGREEWGVNVYCDRVKLLEKIETLSAKLRELSKQATQASPGQAYLLRKKIEALRADEARVEMKRVAAEIEGHLASLSDGAARLRVLKDEASEHGSVVAKFAFLVEREHYEEFRAAAERLADEHATAGYRLELTGPWPAYNFT
ncbi:MAG: hypothetical protein QOC96_1773 [Acidobacteriota bacterium]|jgi:hypothetical protein|nr:hypothetical protein [Acidobacteriota bacterium]